MNDPNQQKRHKLASSGKYQRTSEKPSRKIQYILLGALLCGMIAAAVCFLSASSQPKAYSDQKETFVSYETSVDLPSETGTEVTSPMSTETVLPEESTSDTQNEANKFKPGSEGPLSFEVVRLDNGDRTLNGTNHHNALVYCEYPIFSGSAAAGAINEDVYRIAEAFAHTYTRAEIQEHHKAFGMPYAFSHIGYIEPTHNGNGILSLVLDYNGFWGEDHIYEDGSLGYVYSLATGERLTLTQLTGLPEEQLLQKLQDEAEHCINDYLQRMRNLEITDLSLVCPDALTLDDFGFYVTEEGNIHVTLNGIHMRKAEPARGYWVCFNFDIGYSIY